MWFLKALVLKMSGDTLFIDCEINNYEFFKKSDICRLCLTEGAKTDFISDSNMYSELSYKVFYCVDIHISKESVLKHICEKCSENIEIFYNYKLSCKKADEKLKQVILKQKAMVKAEVKPERMDDDVLLDVPLKNEFDTFLDSFCHSDSSNDCQPLSEIKTIKKKIKEIRKKTKLKLKRRTKCAPTYCNLCRTNLKNTDSLSEHKKKFHGIDNGVFSCFGCDKKFKSARTRLDHELQYCKKLKDGYECGICKRHLPIRRTYEAHMRAHRENATIDLPEKLFKCRVCEERFKTRTSLQQHVAEHRKKPNYVCEVCGRVFTRRDYLHKHTLTHSGVRRHACPHCDFKATQRSTLTIHIRKHTGERPFSCEVCGLRCVSSSNLLAHQRRHAGLKRYQCSVCSKKFGYKLSLEEHIASTHESLKSHTCSMCGTAYSRIRGLKRHMRAKHGPETNGCDSDPGALKEPDDKVAEGQNLQAYFKVVSKGNEMTLEVGTERIQSQVMLCE